MIVKKKKLWQEILVLASFVAFVIDNSLLPSRKVDSGTRWVLCLLNGRHLWGKERTNFTKNRKET